MKKDLYDRFNFYNFEIDRQQKDHLPTEGKEASSSEHLFQSAEFVFCKSAKFF